MGKVKAVSLVGVTNPSPPIHILQGITFEQMTGSHGKATLQCNDLVKSTGLRIVLIFVCSNSWPNTRQLCEFEPGRMPPYVILRFLSFRSGDHLQKCFENEVR